LEKPANIELITVDLMIVMPVRCNCTALDGQVLSADGHQSPAIFFGKQCDDFLNRALMTVWLTTFVVNRPISVQAGSEAYSELDIVMHVNVSQHDNQFTAPVALRSRRRVV
jgi:hypothetical protein